ncbi:MAG: hypothetical protein AB9869_35255 [Verrucomicrobiia bacterium]
MPFPWAAFIGYDLEADADEKRLSEKEHDDRRRQAESCRDASVAVEVTSCDVKPQNKEERDEAYLECGYRTVDESDVMIFVLRHDEFERVKALIAAPPANRSAGPRVGTFGVACYALATGRPVVLLNADAQDMFASRVCAVPDEQGARSNNWFVDPLVTEAVRKAGALQPDHETVLREKVSKLSGPMTPARHSVVSMGAHLGALANQHQSKTRNRLRWILRFHLFASALAAVGATVIHALVPADPRVLLLLGLAIIGLFKPGLAFGAWLIERVLHGDANREAWLHARVLAELCRGAVSTWSLPLQPLDAQDEEDFPRMKRLVRTLRLLREQDSGAAVQGIVPEKGEPQRDANMRAACRMYCSERLEDQAKYYFRELAKAQRQGRNYRRGFQIATWSAITVGLVLAANRFAAVWERALFGALTQSLLEMIIIVAPFAAAYALSTMTLLDVRRRSSRYEELGQYLNRLAKRLERTQANPSRLRLIEHAERTLIEEQHEWFSVMRNLSV